ncbi:MAG TPA: DUF6526 family protein [Terracidiphilus sp.]|jgi:hypothetical protein|nr:DUF6526 family protein [Terracidiphilus sp.]
MSKTQEPQDLKHHGRLHPPYHVVTFFILVANLVFAVSHVIRHFSVWSAWIVVLSVVVFIPFALIRGYPLKVQDRVIRLEERLRLQALAPAEWHSQIYRLREDQLIGLRFAADDEVVELAKHALEQNLSRKQIKERIKSWRPDYWRV